MSLFGCRPFQSLGPNSYHPHRQRTAKPIVVSLLSGEIIGLIQLLTIPEPKVGSRLTKALNGDFEGIWELITSKVEIFSRDLVFCALPPASAISYPAVLFPLLHGARRDFFFWVTKGSIQIIRSMSTPSRTSFIILGACDHGTEEK